jgi:RNA polymerase sigma-70 factor, ECF subfamily
VGCHRHAGPRERRVSAKGAGHVRRSSGVPTGSSFGSRLRELGWQKPGRPGVSKGMATSVVDRSRAAADDGAGHEPGRGRPAWDDRRSLPRTLDPQALGDHLDRLYRAAWALTGSREDAEDLVQDTYERVLRRPRFVRKDDNLGYLYRTLHNTYFNARRTASRRPRITAELDDVQAASSRSDSQPELAAETNLVLGAVALLAKPMREVLVAVDVLGLSYAEAGRALGVHENTIPSRLARARLKVVEVLEG